MRARYLVLATNGYLGGLAPRLAGRIMPINNFIVATAPLGEARARALIRDDVAVADTKFVVDYFRLSADRRLLFGGGETYRHRFPKDIAGLVRPRMLRVYPQLADVAIDYAWGGTLAITRTAPAPLRPARAGGVGGARIFRPGDRDGDARRQADRRGGGRAPPSASTSWPPSRCRAFPVAPVLRWPALVLGMLYYGLRDRL